MYVRVGVALLSGYMTERGLGDGPLNEGDFSDLRYDELVSLPSYFELEELVHFDVESRVCDLCSLVLEELLGTELPEVSKISDCDE